MSLATRCPHCNTAFRLVRDQLLLSQGWVRCGRCGEAFNAAERQFTFDAAPGGVDPSSRVSAVPEESSTLLGHVRDDGYGNGQTPPSSTDPVPPPGLTSAKAAAGAPRVLGAVPLITASPWQVGAFAYAPFAPKPPAVPPPLPVPASHDAKDEPFEAQASGSIAAADLGLRPLAAEDDRDWLSEALASETTALGLGLALEANIAKAPVANADADADAAIQLGRTVHDQEAQASPSPSPSAAELLRVHTATEDDLATFSAEAEAALRSASPALASATMDGGMGASTPQSPMEDALVEPPPPPVSAKPHIDSHAEPGEHHLNAMHPHSLPLDTGHVESQSPSSFDIAPDQELDEESRFDLGAALHYEFEPELEPTFDADAKDSQLAAPAGNDPALAPAQGARAPGAEDGGHESSASSASVLDVAPATPLLEPQFLRQARARERWQRPAIRALLAVLSVVLVAAGATQAAWTWRDAIAARWPQTQPALARLCAISGCTLEAPRRPQALVIDTSSMVPDAQGVLKLTASLRNRSAEPVAYPALELTLTDTQDRIVARKVIEPRDYLHPLPGNAAAARQRILHGLAGGAELSIQLNLHLSKDQASGYTLYAFYP